MAPEEYPKYHKTHCLAKPRWYNTIWYTFRSFKYPKGAQRDLICSQNSPFRPFEDPTRARKGKNRSQTLPNTYLGWLHWYDTFLLSFIPFWHSQGPLKGRFGSLKAPKRTFLDVFSNWKVQVGLYLCQMIRAFCCDCLDTPHAYVLTKTTPDQKWGPWKGDWGPKSPFRALVDSKVIQKVQSSSYKFLTNRIQVHGSHLRC